MPGANVNWPIPLMRLPPWFPGQMGVPGTDTDTGIRSSSAGTVFYVDPNFPGASDARDGTNPTSPLLTVAKALTLVQPQRGDVIVVGSNDAWQYAPGGTGVSTDYATAISEEVTIPYTASGVRIVGLSAGTMGVMWTPASNAGTCITCHAIDVIIEGFVFTEGDYTGCDAVYCEWDGITLFGENMTVRNCHFDDTVDTAIELEFSWYCDIHNNRFQQNDVVAVMSAVGGSGTAYTHIHDNTFMDCAIAISLLGGADNNEIYDNILYNASAAGAAAAANEGINTTGGSDNIVTNNWLSCLLPVPANGDLDDFCTSAGTATWIGNHCSNGLQVTDPT